MKKPAKKKDQIVEDTAAAATIQAKPSDASRAALMAQGFAAMAAMDKSQLEAMLAQVGHEADQIPDGAAASNAATVQAKGDAKSVMTQAMKEDFEELFGGFDLSEDFKSKSSVLIEAVVEARVTALEVALEEEFATKLDEGIKAAVETIEEQVDRYVSFAAEQFVEKNELAIDTSLRSELAESMLGGMFEVLARHGVQLPEEQVDIAEALADKVAELEAQLNETTDTLITMSEALETYAAKDVFTEVSKGMALTQIDRFKKLSEGIEFETAEEYETKLKIIKETIVKPGNSDTSKPTEALIAEDIQPDTEPVTKKTNTNDPMDRYMGAISRSLVK